MILSLLITTLKTNTMITITAQTKEAALYGVTEQLKEFITKIGRGFHPDDDFGDYINVNGDCSQIFTDEEIKTMNAQLQECHDMCEIYGLDIYGISLNLMS